MTLDNKPIYTGGCQCGAVRFRVDGAMGSASICHCRMCQKAFGNFYAPLVSVSDAKLEWTRNEPKRFRSSNHVQRAFVLSVARRLLTRHPTGSRSPSAHSMRRRKSSRQSSGASRSSFPMCRNLQAFPAMQRSVIRRASNL